jgi:hypothetical protein
VQRPALKVMAWMLIRIQRLLNEEVEVRVKEPLVVTRAEKAVQVAEERESRLQPDTNTPPPPLICKFVHV